MAKYKSDDLWEEIITEHSIQCSKCESNDSTYFGDDFDACAKFFKEGWRKTTNYVYCPKCANKYLKK